MTSDQITQLHQKLISIITITNTAPFVTSDMVIGDIAHEALALLDEPLTIENAEVPEGFLLIKADCFLARLNEIAPCPTCNDKGTPKSYLPWLCDLYQEDERLGHGHIKRTMEQKNQLYRMYLDSFQPCPDCK